MADGIYAALSGALAHYTSLETTAQNLANIDTTGYRAVTPVFHEVLANESSDETVRFTSVRRSAIDMTPGALRTTDAPLDLAFGQRSFLAVETPAGERYTRAGSLKIAANGTLTTQRGHAVLGESGQPVVVDTEQGAQINAQGEVTSAGRSVGFLRIVSFENPEQMTYEGQGLLQANAEAGPASRSTEPLEVGKLEESNASTVRAMTDLMAASRMFEAMEQAIGTFSQIDRRLVSSVPKFGG
jgi:flagellar basal-body rod protein FlgF